MDNYMGPFVAVSVKKGILGCSILFLVFVRKVTHYFFTPSQNPQIFSRIIHHFSTMMSLQRVVGFLLRKSCLMALAKVRVLPSLPMYC